MSSFGLFEPLPPSTAQCPRHRFDVIFKTLKKLIDDKYRDEEVFLSEIIRVFFLVGAALRLSLVGDETGIDKLVAGSVDL